MAYLDPLLDSHESTFSVSGRLRFHLKLIQIVGTVLSHVVTGLACPTFRGQPHPQKVQNIVVCFLAGHQDSISLMLHLLLKGSPN